MAVKAKEILEAETITAAADAGYDSVQDIVRSMEQGIRPHVAGEDFNIRVPSEGNETAETVGHHEGWRVYIAKRDIVLCPIGQIVYPLFYKKQNKRGIFCNRTIQKAQD